MTGRLAARAAAAEAMLAGFIVASEAAMAGLARGDCDALTTARGVHDALQHEIDRTAREITLARSRFAADAPRSVRGQRVVDRAMEQYCAPLEAIARAALTLQQRLDESANGIRDGVVGKISTFESTASAGMRWVGRRPLRDSSQ